MSEGSTKIDFNIRNARNWIAANIVKALDGGRWVSDKMFLLLKLIGTISLITIVFFVVKNTFNDLDIISVKPFSVPEAMQSVHKGAGRIFANIIKQRLNNTQAKIDTTIQGESGQNQRPEDFAVNDTGLFKGENIKLPETGISLNDVVEFISGLFGRKIITGSIYKDNNNLYLQLEMSGRIFTAERRLKANDNKTSTSLHLKLIEDMADEINVNVLRVDSEKYRLYYFCLSDQPPVKDEKYPDEYEPDKYEKLYNFCIRAREDRSDELKTLREDLKYDLSDSSNMEQYLVGILSSKINDKIRLLETITQPGSKAASAATQEREKNEIPSTPTQLKGFCNEDQQINKPESNKKEKQAGIDYKNQNFLDANKAYIQAIKANCTNSYAWANLGILLSDVENKIYFDPTGAIVALKKATELNSKAGWIWHSLCVAEEAYNENKSFETAINRDSCRKARSVEPGKQLIYDKLLYIAIAEQYTKSNNHKKAFENYENSILIDPKRTCRLESVIEQMHLIKNNTETPDTQKTICEALNKSYKPAKPDEVCETQLLTYQDDYCR